MKKNVKRWLALILAVAMVSGTCLAHADGFLAATDGEETQVTQESAQAVADEAGGEDEQLQQEPVEEVPEGTTLYFEIEIKGNYLVDSVKDQNGAEIAPTNVSGNVTSYKMVIKENKELTIMYKEAPKEEAEAEVEEETGLSKAPIARVAKAADYTVEAGKTVTIKGHKNKECGYEHKWESSDPSIATVSSPGRTTTLTGKKAGTVTITPRIVVESMTTGSIRLKPKLLRFR